MKLAFLTVTGFSALCCIAAAGQYNYAVWGSGNGNTLSGTVAGVGITFSGPYDSVLTNYAGGYYDDSPSDYISSAVSNAPAFTDNFIQLNGGNSDLYSLTFSQPISNLVLSILSLGNGSDPTPFVFTVPFTLLSQGPDQWGGSTSSLTVSGDTLTGTEGSGSIQFTGTTSSLTWHLPVNEGWYGLTVAAVPEPSSFAALGLGAGAFALLRRRRK